MKQQYNSLSKKGSYVLYCCTTNKRCWFLLFGFSFTVFFFTLITLQNSFPEGKDWLSAIFPEKTSVMLPNKSYYMISNQLNNGSKVNNDNPLKADSRPTNIIVKNNANNNIVNNSKSNEGEIAEIASLKRRIEAENEKQTIFNLERFGSITNDTIIISIQAHQRLEYLKELINSFENARYINNTLLVFSHGFYSEEINKVVRSIKFTRVIQIFFPYSLQTHPDSFPGFTRGDCPWGVPKEEVAKMNCSGKARDVKSLQVKHHWWWKVNTIFNKLRVTQKFTGLVFFLEEDHYIFPDTLYMLRLMKKSAPQLCPDCNIFGLGKNPQRNTISNYMNLSHKVRKIQWNNMGFAFDRKFWNGMSSKRCSDMFCEYNDYNWDFTVAYLSHKCLPQLLTPLNVVSPRVFHIGDCGLHFHGNCSAKKSLKVVKDLENQVGELLFPPTLTATNMGYWQMPVDGHNGGWDDPRDIQLCKNMSLHQETSLVSGARHIRQAAADDTFQRLRQLFKNF